MQPNLISKYSILSQNVLWKYWITVFKVNITVKAHMSINICLNDIFWTAEHFATKRGIVMQHHEPECLLSSRSKSYEGLIWSKYMSFKNQFAIKVKVTVRAHISSELLMLWRPQQALMVHQSVGGKKKKNYCIQGQGHSKASLPVCPTGGPCEQ